MWLGHILIWASMVLVVTSLQMSRALPENGLMRCISGCTWGLSESKTRSWHMFGVCFWFYEFNVFIDFHGIQVKDWNSRCCTVSWAAPSVTNLDIEPGALGILGTFKTSLNWPWPKLSCDSLIGNPFQLLRQSRNKSVGFFNVPLAQPLDMFV